MNKLTMLEYADYSDPIEYLPLWIDLFASTGAILVVVLDDDAQRGMILRTEASRSGAPFLTCDKFRSTKQFLKFLAAPFGLVVSAGFGRTIAFGRSYELA